MVRSRPASEGLANHRMLLYNKGRKFNWFEREVFRSRPKERSKVMQGKSRAISVVAGLVFLLVASSGATAEVVELKKYPLDDLQGVITKNDVAIDKEQSSDGKGSLKITATEPRTVRLFETGDLGVDNARIIYSARLKTENVKGKVYLEMWCHFPGKGEFFSRGLDSPLSGTTDWVTVETPFFLQKGQKPDNVKLNLVVDGTGTVWIDDIKLLKAPLQ